MDASPWHMPPWRQAFFIDVLIVDPFAIAALYSAYATYHHWQFDSIGRRLSRLRSQSSAVSDAMVARVRHMAGRSRPPARVGLIGERIGSAVRRGSAVIGSAVSCKSVREGDYPKCTGERFAMNDSADVEAYPPSLAVPAKKVTLPAPKMCTTGV